MSKETAQYIEDFKKATLHLKIFARIEELEQEKIEYVKNKQSELNELQSKINALWIESNQYVFGIDRSIQELKDMVRDYEIPNP